MKRIAAAIALAMATTTANASTLMLGCQTNNVEFVLSIANNTAMIVWDVEGAKPHPVTINFDNPPMLKVYQRFDNGVTFAAIWNAKDNDGFTETTTTDGRKVNGGMTCIKIN